MYQRFSILMGLVLLLPLASHAQVQILDYTDFGPQAAAWPLLGMQVWSWRACGGCSTTTPDPIKVVVYRKVSLARLKQRYPIDPAHQRDYRYISWQLATRYLQREIQADLEPTVTTRLQQTLQLLQQP